MVDLAAAGECRPEECLLVEAWGESGPHQQGAGAIPALRRPPRRQYAWMRIGTWNLAGRWSVAHQRFLEDAESDVWLLSEVPPAFSLPGGNPSRSEPMTASGTSWAAVWSTGSPSALPSPHPAAAMVWLGDLLICSCVLPWRGARPYWPDQGSNTADITIAAVDRLEPLLASGGRAVVWGGDWNHAMTGREEAGSMEGRRAIQRLVTTLGLSVTTINARHRIDGLLSIDHIAVPAGWESGPRQRVVAEAQGTRLSDHDAYLVEVTRP